MVAPDGGNAANQPYDQPGRHLPNTRTFFPIGVWLARVNDPAEASFDKSLGLNTYFALDHNYPASDLNVIEAAGMHVIANVNDWHDVNHPAIDGWLVTDEPDAFYQAGNDPWSGVEGWNKCIPPQDQGGNCGYTVLDYYNSLIPDGDLRWTNYTKQLINWTDQPDQIQFVDGGNYQDVLSADTYWFIDPYNDNPEDRKGAMYGWMVNELQRLDGLTGGTAPADRQPIWALVDVGHPASGGGTITPAQTRSGVWHSIIAGARGIIYFNHSFGGPCPSFNVLRSSCPGAAAMRTMVQTIDTQIAQLAVVFNNATAQQYITKSANLEATAWIGGNDAPFGNGIYTIAGANWSEYTHPGPQQGKITINSADGPCIGTATVLYENRTLPITNCVITDTFANGNAIHIYKW